MRDVPMNIQINNGEQWIIPYCHILTIEIFIPNLFDANFEIYIHRKIKQNQSRTTYSQGQAREEDIRMYPRNDKNTHILKMFLSSYDAEDIAV